MVQSLWIAKTGMEAQQLKLDVISNNLANVSTDGFKRSRAKFQDLMYQNLRQPGARSSVQTRLPSGLQIGTGVQMVATERLHTQGDLKKTGNSKDLAIQGNGFFAVQMPNGQTAFTRDGSFQLNRNGQLVTASGYPLQPPVTIPPNALSITIAEDGTVSVRQPGSNTTNEVGQIMLTTFPNPAGLQSVGDNLYKRTSSSGARNVQVPGMNGAGRVLQNYVESSNVNVVQELVNMIAAQRAYQINSKVVKTTDQMLQSLTRL